MYTWEVVKRIEETSQISAEQAKAMLLCNFGPNGVRARRIVYASDPLHEMVMKVCNYYESQLLYDAGDKLEIIAEAVHNAWWGEKIRQGEDDHPDAIPYSELAENVKEYDRVTARAVLQALQEGEEE